MVLLEAVKASNNGLRAAIPNITALFVGGTSGMGQSTLRHLAKSSDKPNAYIVGRSESRASPFMKELKQINPNGNFTFIEADVSLIKEVDKACEKIKEKEERLNLIFMTAGGISLSGRKETKEGLDHLFSLRYYSRMRLVQNLMPLLEQAEPARVVSIFGGGFEGPINKDDLDLKKSYSVLNCAMHSITMTTLSMEHLASAHKAVSFAHIYPGLVGTNIYSNSFPPPLSTLYNYAVWPAFMWPFSVGLDESGARHLFHSTSARYSGLEGKGGVPLENGVEMAQGSDGQVGSGTYLMNWKGETFAAGKTMQAYREEGLAEKVWQHTTELLQKSAQ